jgi:hypothetical protein
MLINISQYELTATLAGLRMLQKELIVVDLNEVDGHDPAYAEAKVGWLTLDDDLDHILTDGKNVAFPMGSDQIDSFCKRLSGEEPEGISDRELSTILAALRYWQQALSKADAYDLMPDFFHDGEDRENDPLTEHEIDDLVARLNLGE